VSKHLTHVVESITGKTWYAGEINRTPTITGAMRLKYWDAYDLMKALNSVPYSKIRWTVEPIGNRLKAD
jgi:hypothetical protein